MVQDFQYSCFGSSSRICHYQTTPVDFAFGRHNEPFWVLQIYIICSRQRLLSLQLYKTLPKVLRTQALTTLTSFVGLVWLSMFGLVDLVW